MHWGCIEDALEMHWICIGDALEMHWRCFGDAMETPLQLCIFQDIPNACCFSNDGQFLLVGMTDGRWVIVDVESKCLVDEIHDLNDGICCMEFSPNGCSLAVATKTGIIHLYQVSNDAKKYNRIGRCTDEIGGKKGQRSSSTGSPVNFTFSNTSITLDWSLDSNFIRSNAQDASLCFCK